jgi:hypothetical protein
MDVTHVDIPQGASLTAIFSAVLTAVIGVAIRTWLKDRQERKEREQRVFQRCCRQAYNSVVNKVKKVGKELVGDKAEAGLEALDRFLVLARGKPANQEEREQALLIFDAIHGEHCPGGAPAPVVPTDPM